MIVSCGEALVDLLPEAVPGGGPMNVAIAASRLGVPAAFLGRVSTDDHGDSIWRHLVANGVDLRAAERGPEPTARAIVEHVPELRFRFEGEGTADTQLTAADLGLLGAGPHIVHGGTLGMFRGRTAQVLATLAEAHDGIVSLDPNIRPPMIEDRVGWLDLHRRWVAATSIYRGSDEDFDWIWPGRAIEDCVAELHRGGVRVVVVTRGAAGADFSTPAGSVRIPGRSVELVDTVGAGDTFVGSLLASLWTAGLLEPEALDDVSLDVWQSIGERAVAAAAISVGRAGADPPTSSEVDQLLADT